MDSSAALATSTMKESDSVEQTFQSIALSIRQISEMSVQIAAAVEEQTTVTGEVSQNIVTLQGVADNLAEKASKNSAQSRTIDMQSKDPMEKVHTFTV